MFNQGDFYRYLTTLAIKVIFEASTGITVDNPDRGLRQINLSDKSNPDSLRFII